MSKKLSIISLHNNIVLLTTKRSSFLPVSLLQRQSDGRFVVNLIGKVRRASSSRSKERQNVTLEFRKPKKTEKNKWVIFRLCHGFRLTKRDGYF